MGNKTRAANQAYKQRMKEENPGFHWTICPEGALMNHKPGERITYKSFITPGFDAATVNIHEPQTITTWKNYFLSTNPETKVADSYPEVLRANLHIGSVRMYLMRKKAKGLLRTDDPAPEWIPYETVLKNADSLKVNPSQVIRKS